MEDILEKGKWLEFEAGTCFGNTKHHFGILLGVDYDTRIAVVAVNATSQVEKLIRFADYNNIPIADAMVDVTDDIHFSKPTGIDCHRPTEVKLDDLNIWVQEGKVYKTSYNEDINPDKFNRIIEIVLRSPLVEPSIKAIISKSNSTK